MDTNVLVGELADDGRKLLERLAQEGFDVTAAFWVRSDEDGAWRFYIASPAADGWGVTEAYRRVHAAVRGMLPPFWVDPLEIKLIGAEHPVTKDVLAIHERAAGNQGYPIRWEGSRLGNLSVDGAYLYPLAAAVTT